MTTSADSAAHEKVLKDFASSTFQTMMTAEKDSVELNQAVSSFVDVLMKNPELKFNRLTQFCCQFVDSKLQDSPDSFPTKSTMVPLRLTQFLKNYLTKRKEYHEDHIRRYLPGFLDTFLIQQENKEKKKKKLEQQSSQQTQQQPSTNASTTDDLADAFALEFGESVGSSTSSASTNESSSSSSLVATQNKKKRKNTSLEPTASKRSNTAAIDANSFPKSQDVTEDNTATQDDDDDFMEPDFMISTMHSLLQQEKEKQMLQQQQPSCRSSLSLAVGSGSNSSNNSTYRISSSDPRYPLVKDPVLAIDAASFMLFHCVYNQNRANEDITTVFTVISQLLDALKHFVGKKSIVTVNP